MTEPFLLKKAVDLSPVALGKSFSVGIKFVLVIGVLFFFTIGVMSCLKKPLPALTQTADTIVSPTYNLQPHFGGCASIKIPQRVKK